jgi:hypothetical protein
MSTEPEAVEELEEAIPKKPPLRPVPPPARVHHGSASYVLTKDRLIPYDFRIRGYPHTAYFLGITEDTLRQLNKLGVIPYFQNADGKTIKGRFDLIDALRAYCTDLQGRHFSKTSTLKGLAGKIEEAKYQKLQSQTEREVIHNEMLRGTIARMEDVDTIVIDIILNARSKLMSMPTYAIRQMPIDEELHDQCVKILTTVLEQALEDLAAPGHDAILSLNRKLAKFTDVLATPNEETKEETTEVI